MSQEENIIGLKFGKLTVSRKLPKKDKQISNYYECLCECENTINISEYNILNKKKSTCGCINGKNLLGQKFGLLTAVSKDDNFKCSYICECSCGGKKTVKASTLISGRNISCGCRMHAGSGRIEDRRKKVLGDIYLYKYMKRHKKFSPEIKSDISLEEFLHLSSQDCYYCGEEPSNQATDMLTKVKVKYNGLDRINSNVGYMKYNCVPCCSFCNSFKMTLTQDEFLSKIKQIADAHGLW